eukprot:CAMPEP_0170515890 /NCGR_PEP_ID=MMETSP0209-20121228/2277_1 /TAXON_ID=665100 ORGANISM="Litonotus pictus, Strain P1" /NCGR_SAMPLE_ID=MMETSP0209 /ASSEMBLY_ACC=CAM_ASM_000301 /LENGTH=336 /DNA_ID=CAMNT_0010800597 /DNA_START=123 /DNA_END=1133 /DNA_ORIENTATION=-
MRADPQNGIPTDNHVDYFTQRAEDAGFVLSGCCSVSFNGEGFPGNSKAFNKDHMEGWKKVFDSVHKVNGKIFVQIYHAGRATVSENIGGENPVGPSNIANRHEGKFPEPTPLDKDGINKIKNDFVNSAKMLKDVGADGVEIHCGNGFLIDQFLKDSTNQRTDEYGGSVENRSRFMFEIVDEVSKVMGAGRVGVKISPAGRYNDMFDSNPKSLLDYLLPQLNKRKIGFVEIIRPPDGAENLYDIKGEDQLPNIFDGLKKLLPDVVLVGNAGFSPDEAAKMIKEGTIDMVSFARNYIANPDLSARIKNNWPLAQPDFSKAYGGGAEGYSDYPKYTPEK